MAVLRAFFFLVATLVLTSIAFAQDRPAVDPNWVVPPKAAEKKNPLGNHPDAAAGGGKIFSHTCVTCHGDATHARTNNAPDLSSPDVQAESDGALFWRISNGNARTAMPSFNSLPEGQRWQLVMYIRTLARRTASK